jgi:hypothetical protein
MADVAMVYWVESKRLCNSDGKLGFFGSAHGLKNNRHISPHCWAELPTNLTDSITLSFSKAKLNIPLKRQNF